MNETGAKLVYDSNEGLWEMSELLGGKGANLAEMTRVIGADRVPAGPDNLDPLGHYERPASNVEGLVRRMPGGSSSLPGRTSQLSSLCSYREPAVRPGEVISKEHLERWHERGLIRAMRLRPRKALPARCRCDRVRA
jgi:hypothetical protein